MKIKSFRELIERARQTDDYWSYSAVLDFTEELFLLMEKNKINKAELARRLGTSPAYITKVLRGNVNFTMATLGKFARVFQKQVRLHLSPVGTVFQPMDIPWQALTTNGKGARVYAVRKVTPSVPSRTPAPPAEAFDSSRGRETSSSYMIKKEDGPNAGSPAAA